MSITVHPDRVKLSVRAQVVGRERLVPFEGELYRFIDPRFYKAADTLSGVGALHACGRWNLVGACRLSYTALCPDTALSEALAHVRYYELPLSKALPRVLVAVRLKVSRALDLRDGQVRKSLVLGENTIRNLDWRAENQQGREALTQAWGYAFARAGFEAVLTPSAVHPFGFNALVFPDNLLPGSHFSVVNEVRWT